MSMLPMQNPVASAPRAAINPNDTVINHMNKERAVDAQAQKDQLGIQESQMRMQNMEQDREIKGYEAMMQNPENAEMVAQQYGIPFTDNTRAMLKNPMQMQRVIRGATLAKSLGIANPEAQAKLLRTYLETDGDNDAAVASIQGMDLTAPMNQYQQAQLGMAKQRDATMNAYRQAQLGLSAQRNASTDAYRKAILGQYASGIRGKQGNPMTADMEEQIQALPPAERMEAYTIYKKLQTGKLGEPGLMVADPENYTIADDPNYKRLTELLSQPAAGKAPTFNQAPNPANAPTIQQAPMANGGQSGAFDIKLDPSTGKPSFVIN